MESTKYQQLQMILTESPVGKTSLITRFMYDTFDDNYAVSMNV